MSKLDQLDPTLAEFGKCTLALTELLQKDVQLDMMEQMFIENHIEVVRVTFNAWKRRKTS